MKRQQDLASQDFPTAAQGEKCSTWVLLGVPLALGLALSVLVILVQVAATVDVKSIYLGLDGLRMPIGLSLLGLVLMTGLLVRFRPQFRTLLVATVVLGASGLTLSKTVRVESFYGNMVPRLAWKWTPSAEERIEGYLVSSSARATLGSASKDLFEARPDDFPQFLGTYRDARIPGELQPDWTSCEPKLLWRHPVGIGWSSFAIVGGVAVGLEQRGELECVVAYDARTGVELWCQGEAQRFEDEHGDGPRSTPTIHDGRVYSMGATGLLTCVDFRTGQLIWKQATLNNPEVDNLLWGMSGSPLVIDDEVVVTPGGGAAMIAFDTTNGCLRWRAGDDPAGYASPLATHFSEVELLLSFNGAGLRAFSRKGEALWLFPWLTQGESQRVNVAQPIVVRQPTTGLPGEYVLISTGYGNGMALIEVSRDTASESGWATRQVWHSRDLKSKMSNFVVYGPHVYGLDNGILTCIDLATGSRVWKGGRYGHGQMLLVDGKLLIQTEAGDVVLVLATPQSHQEVARLAALADKTWNNLALAGKLLIVRNDREAAAYELP